MNRRLSDGVDRLSDEEARLCAALGLDPNEVTEVYLEIQPGRGAAARWTSVRKVDLDRIVQALEPVPVEIPEAEKWKVPPNPWDEEHPDDVPLGSVGTCMEPAPQIISGVIPPSCALPAGHPGGHRNNRGMEWIVRKPAEAWEGPDGTSVPATPIETLD